MWQFPMELPSRQSLYKIVKHNSPLFTPAIQGANSSVVLMDLDDVILAGPSFHRIHSSGEKLILHWGIENKIQ